MNCRHCQHWNPEDEQRCRLCGRRLRSSGNDTTNEWAINAVTGNLAAAPEPVRSVREPAASAGAQRDLFPERPASNVIRFDIRAAGARPAPRVESPPAQPPQPAPRTETRSRRASTSARKTTDQPQLDFLPSSVAPRTLKTSVQAVIFCDAPVATLTHRSLAAAIDFSLILVGYGLCLTSYFVMGGGFPGGRFGYATFAAVLLVMVLFYGMVWTLARTETPGMRWTSLRLTNFDGFAPEPGQRLLRYFASVLSFGCGFGLLWALVDEESLTWQDHISKTFPTFHRAD